MVLAHDVQQQVRMVVTEQLMSLWLLPATIVQLGRDLGRPFPEELQKLTSPDLLHLLAGFESLPYRSQANLTRLDKSSRRFTSAGA
jgi:hypothetical protein